MSFNQEIPWQKKKSAWYFDKTKHTNIPLTFQHNPQPVVIFWPLVLPRDLITVICACITTNVIITAQLIWLCFTNTKEDCMYTYPLTRRAGLKEREEKGKSTAENQGEQVCWMSLSERIMW